MNWAPYQIWQVRQSSANNWSLNLSSLRLMDQPIPFWAFSWQIPFGEPDLSHFSTGHFPTCKPLCNPAPCQFVGFRGWVSSVSTEKTPTMITAVAVVSGTSAAQTLHSAAWESLCILRWLCVQSGLCLSWQWISLTPIQYAFDAHWKQSKWGPVSVGCQRRSWAQNTGGVSERDRKIKQLYFIVT